MPADEGSPRSEAPTLPPPPLSHERPVARSGSAPIPRNPVPRSLIPRRRDPSGADAIVPATEVMLADLRKDPRRER